MPLWGLLFLLFKIRGLHPLLYPNGLSGLNPEAGLSFILPKVFKRLKCYEKCDLYCPESDRIPFGKIATEYFSSPVFVNMIALGKLLQKIGINIETINFNTVFPSQFFDENIRAISYGYTYQD